MIKYLDWEGKQRSRELWEEAFPEDSQSFDDYYYGEKLKDNRILAIVETGEQIHAMIQMNPYLVQVGNHRWKVDYLVGVATLREKRHQGYMRRLLEQMATDMRAEGMPFCFLMPADEKIYKPFGFTYIYRQPHWRLKGCEKLSRRGLLTPDGFDTAVEGQEYLKMAAEWMNLWLSSRYEVYAVRSTEYLQCLMQELISENGTLDLLYDGDVMVGIQGEWGIKEREQRLLYCESSYVEETEDAKPAIMARIITLETFVRAIHLEESAPREVILKLVLEDPLIAENQGVWLWHLSHETSWLEREDKQTKSKEGNVLHTTLQLTIAELTAWLFGYGIPEAAQSAAKFVRTLKGVFLDEVV